MLDDGTYSNKLKFDPDDAPKPAAVRLQLDTLIDSVAAGDANFDIVQPS